MLPALVVALALAPSTLAECAGIEVDRDRLACYDRVAGREVLKDDAELQLIDFVFRAGAAGLWQAEGRVKNVSGAKLEHIQVFVSFMDADSHLLATASGMVAFDPLEPGDVSTFTAIAATEEEIRSATVEFGLMGGRKLSTRRPTPE